MKLAAFEAMTVQVPAADEVKSAPERVGTSLQVAALVGSRVKVTAPVPEPPEVIIESADPVFAVLVLFEILKLAWAVPANVYVAVATTGVPATT